MTNLKKIRLKNKLKALEVAKACGIQPCRISLIENDWVKPTEKEINKLISGLRKLKVDISFLKNGISL